MSQRQESHFREDSPQSLSVRDLEQRNKRKQSRRNHPGGTPEEAPRERAESQNTHGTWAATPVEWREGWKGQAEWLTAEKVLVRSVKYRKKAIKL